MEQPDYSDLHKFLVSIGIVLIGLAGASIWIVVNTNDLLLLKQNDIDQLSSVASIAIIQKQNTSISIFKNIVYISIIPFILGISSFIIGILKWKKRQRIVDQLQDHELNKLIKDLSDVSAEEKSEQLKKDIVISEGNDPETEIVNEEEKIQEYRSVEQRVISHIFGKYSHTYKMKSEFKVKNQIIDMVMLPRYFGQKPTIIEVKYFSSITKYASVLNGIQQLLLSTIALKEYYSERNIIIDKFNLVLIWVCKTNIQKDKLQKFYESIRKDVIYERLQILIINETEINTISVE